MREGQFVYHPRTGPCLPVPPLFSASVSHPLLASSLLACPLPLIPLPSPHTHTTHTAPHNTDFLVVYPKGPSPVGVLLTILIPIVLGGYAVFMYLDTHQVRVSL